LFVAFTAMLLLSARAFYLGIILVTAVYLATLLYRYFKEKDNNHVRGAVEYAAVLIAAVVFYSLVQAFIYPRNNDQFNKSIAERITTITGETGSSGRVFFWKNSWDLIRDYPLMGVGSGNWKIVELKYENPASQTNGYQYHAHNDFIEMTAEIGVFGGLAYLAVYILAIYYLVRVIAGKMAFGENPVLFISCLGLLCYGVDAFFNFPADRTEMQSLFASYLGSVICFTVSPRLKEPFRKTRISIIYMIHALVLACALCCLYMNFVSLKYQRITKEDIQRNRYTQTAAFMLQGFPFMPDISSYGEPVVCFKSRYLMNEKKHDQAIRLLKNDKSSPYDARVPEFICLCYHDWGRMDSSLKYAEKCITMKPAYYKYTGWACGIYDAKGESDRSIKLIQAYLQRVRSNPDVWLDLSSTYAHLEDGKRSIAALDTALTYWPGDSALLSNKEEIMRYFTEKKFKEQFQEADLYFNKKEFRRAVACYTRIIGQDTSLLRAYEFRGLGLLSLKEYEKAIADFSFLIRQAPLTGKYYNNRGVCYIARKSTDDACRDFEKAKNLGDTNALNNYNKFCSRK
jgi:putative inorganic carbon (hco3(-)) transporter